MAIAIRDEVIASDIKKFQIFTSGVNCVVAGGAQTASSPSDDGADCLRSLPPVPQLSREAQRHG